MDGGIVMATDALADLAMNEAMDAQIDAAKQAGHVEIVEAPQDADLETFCAGLGLVVPPVKSPSTLATKTREDGAPMTQEPIE